MRVLFLDFDGVLNSRAYVEAAGWQPPLGSQRDAYILDPLAIDWLNVIVERTGAVVVITSSWRATYSVETLRALLETRGFRGRVHGVTPELAARDRASEIAHWLASNAVEAFAVVDDDDIGAPRLVRTSFETGLTGEHAERLIRLLTS